MKLSMNVALSEAQKAQIIARGEDIGKDYTFEMTRKYAAIFSRIRGYSGYATSDDEIAISNIEELRVPQYSEIGGGWHDTFHIYSYFYAAIAAGTLQDGANCDPIMQAIEKQLDAHDAAKQAEREQDERKKAERKAEKAEREKPENIEKAERIAEEKRIAKEVEDAKEAERKAAKQAEIKTAKAEKLAWIEVSGSERLRKGIAAGYHCQKIYVAERGNSELGDAYRLDYASDIATKDRSCPTLEALAEAERLTTEGIKAKVVWLPDGFSDEPDDYHEGYEPCEAVEVILLGNYFYREI